MNHSLRRLAPKGEIGDWCCVECGFEGKLIEANLSECYGSSTQEEKLLDAVMESQRGFDRK